MPNKTKKAQVVIACLDAKNKTFQFLLLHTNERRGQFWQNVTGKIEKDESFEDGALREAIEETGLPVELIVDLLDLGISHHFTDQHKRDVHEKAYLLILESKWEVVLDPHEHQSFKWVMLEHLHEELVKHKGNYEALEKASKLLTQWGV